MADISCSFREGEEEEKPFEDSNELLTARLRKPDGFRGAPIFADARQVDGATDGQCRITGDPKDPQGLTYDLRVTDLDKCGVLRKNVS